MEKVGRKSKAFSRIDMMYKIVLKTLAEQDITEAAEWYFANAPHLTSQFIEKIEEALNMLQKSPEQYQRRYNQVRVFFTSIFPYGLYYTLEKDTIIIHAVLHTKRNPEKGIERI
jgi:toxin ParE1/3/4